MTLTALKLVRVQIFVSIGIAIAKKNGVNGKCARPPGRPTDRPPRPTGRNHDSNTPLGFQPEG